MIFQTFVTFQFYQSAGIESASSEVAKKRENDDEFDSCFIFEVLSAENLFFHWWIGV